MDVGGARIGVAKCDTDGVMAVPVETVQRKKHKDFGVGRLLELAEEAGAVAIVVGIPVSLSGDDGPAAQDVRRYAKRMAHRMKPRPIYLVDERLTTSVSHRALSASGRRHADRKSVVDQAAAVEILETALNIEKSTGTPAGELLEIAGIKPLTGGEHEGQRDL